MEEEVAERLAVTPPVQTANPCKDKRGRRQAEATPTQPPTRQHLLRPENSHKPPQLELLMWCVELRAQTGPSSAPHGEPLEHIHNLRSKQLAGQLSVGLLRLPELTEL